MLFEALQEIAQGNYWMLGDRGWSWQPNPLYNDFDSPWAAYGLELLARFGYGQDEEEDERPGFYCDPCEAGFPPELMDFGRCPQCGELIERACSLDRESGAVVWVEPDPLRIPVTIEEYRELTALEMPCEYEDVSRILKDERAAAIISATFHGTPVEVVPTLTNCRNSN
jgi:hypothetical protein